MKLSTVSNDILPLSATTLRTIPQDSCLLIDTRPVSKFNSCHIRNAVNVNCSPLLLRRIQRGSGSVDKLFSEETKKNLQRGLCQIIVLYDDDSSEGGMLGKEMKLIATALQREKKNKSFFYLNGGFKTVSKEHPTLCESTSVPTSSLSLGLYVDHACNTDMNDPTDQILYSPMENEPVQVLPYLFLGSAYHASDKDVLERLGITAIVNVSRNCPNMFEGRFTYKTVPVDDSYSEDIGSHFTETSCFIDDVKSKKGKVLVHCKAGISRSATICIAYLMTKQRLTLDEAYEFIKKRRSVISPNFNFLGQLLTLESSVFAEKENSVFAEKENSVKTAPAILTPFFNASRSVPLLGSSENMFIYPSCPSTPCSFQASSSSCKVLDRSPLLLQSP